MKQDQRKSTSHKSKRRLDTFEDEQVESREKEFCNDSGLAKDFVDLYNEIEKAFQNQAQRADKIADYWDCYNAVINHNQYYNGTSSAYVPIIYDAIQARKTRFNNQVFPQSGRYIDVTTEDGNHPHSTMALLEFYIRALKLKVNAIPELLKSGDIEGQYTICVGWEKFRRDVVYRVERQTELEGEQGVTDPESTTYDIVEETIVQGMPTVEVISDCDFVVLPVTSPTIDHAINNSGSVTIIRRWNKAKINQMIDEGHFDEEAGKSLLKSMADSKFPSKNTDKKISEAAGIKTGEGGKFALIYETYTKLKVEGKVRLYRIFFGGPLKVLSCKRNPFWSDKIPIISCALDKIKGSFKGNSKVAPVATFQYSANDAINEGFDSAHYALAPIVMTDPEKNPNVGTMVLNMAAVWMTSPKDTQVLTFPPLWKDALEIVGQCRAQIFQSLSVNPAAITQTTSLRKKYNQAEIANEQQIDILTTADAVSVLEEGILTPTIHRILELDHQYRDKDLTIEQHGEMGVKASMEVVSPISMNVKHFIKWRGIEAARNAQQIQQQIAGINVLRGIPPQMYLGYRLNLVPAITHFMEATFGPNLAPLIFENIKDQLSIAVEKENELMSQGHDIPVSQFDNIQKHMESHIKELQKTGDPHGTIRTHLQAHQMQVAQMMQQQQQMGKGTPGAPGGAGPGSPGTPRAGAQPGVPRTQGPPGMIHQDQLIDPARTPRQ